MMVSLRLACTVALVAVCSASLGGCVVRGTPQIDRARACQDALAVLRQAAEDRSPATRVHVMEALPLALGRDAGPMCKQALSDPSAEVRFAAAMATGDLRYEPAREKLLRLAKYKVQGAERDARTYCAVIYALHRLGDDSHTGELGELLFDRRQNVRASAAVILGKMREPSATVPLNEALAQELDHGMRLELTRSLARCGDRRSLRLLEAYTKAQFVDERVVAIRAMAELKSPMGARIFLQVLGGDESPRVRVTAAGALARIGAENSAGFRYCAWAALKPRETMRRALGGRREATDQETASLQRLAAMALGWSTRGEAIDVLAALIASDDGGVRVAAAAAILQAMPQYRRGLRPLRDGQARKQEPKPRAEPRVRPRGPKVHSAGAKD